MNGPSGKGIEVVIIDPTRYDGDTVAPPQLMVLLNGKQEGLFSKAYLEFSRESAYPILKLERVLYSTGPRLIHTMTQAEWDAYLEKKQTQVTDVGRCARCGENHEGVELKDFTKPLQVDWEDQTRGSGGSTIFTQWFMCPTLNEPVIVEVTSAE